ncbi:MAG: TatD family hydrolase [bacterium]
MSRKTKIIPQFEQPIIETHCHLDYLEENGDLEDVLERCKEFNVHKIITIAVSADNLVKVRSIVNSHEIVWGTQGIHPHEAEKYSESVEAEIKQHLSDEKMLAVGEIGLDYFYDHADRKVQQKVFAKQLQIAVETSMPVVIHSREADADTQSILSEYAPDMARKGVIHSFTSGVKLAEFCLDAGFSIGFNGIVTFNKAQNVRDVLSIVPLDRVLLETDAPYLTPVPFRGKTNAPFYLPCIAQFVADQKGMLADELITQTTRNAERVFWNI